MTAALWQACKRGDPKARDQIILAHLGYAALTVRRAVPRIPATIDKEDLEAEACLALIKAVDRFDPDRGTEFKTYAIALMRGAVLEYLRAEDWVPRAVRHHQKRLCAAQDAILARQEPVMPLTLAAELNLSTEGVDCLQRAAWIWHVDSLDSILFGEQQEDGPDILAAAEGIADPAPGPEEIALDRVEAQERTEAIREGMNEIDPVYRGTLVDRYLLGKRTEEIAQAEGRSLTAVKNRNRVAIQVLRCWIEEREF
jgi:RNA polymerase sigma factor for flagellar operon FliA